MSKSRGTFAHRSTRSTPNPAHIGAQNGPPSSRTALSLICRGSRLTMTTTPRPLPMPSSPSYRPSGGTPTRPRLEAGESPESTPIPQPQPLRPPPNRAPHRQMAAPRLAKSGAAFKPRKGKPPHAGRPPFYAGCAQALTMLTLRPVFVLSVPRLHVEPRAPDGSFIVYDRATGQRLMVYSPRFVSQFRAGHRAGLWYTRPVTDVSAAPQSLGFRTRRAVVEALRAGRWALPDRARAPCRVIWQWQPSAAR
jgi:hypothetical protein